MIGSTTAAAMAAFLALAGAEGHAGTTLPRREPIRAGAVLEVSAEVTRSPLRGRVRAVMIAPSAAGPTVGIAVDSSVPVRHFLLTNPARLVVDFGAADLGGRFVYDGRPRGPVRQLRVAQFKPDTARVVIELDGQSSYTVERDGGHVRILFDAPGLTFERWVSTPGLIFPDRSARAVAIPPGTAPDELIAPATETAAAPTMAAAAADAGARTRGANDPDPVVASNTEPLTPRESRPTTRRESLGPSSRQPRPKPRITVSFDGNDIADVVATFASFSGRNIILGKDVAGTVTADIVDKPWDVALQAILQAQGLAANEDAAGIITVDSYQRLAANQALEPLVTQVLDINYAKATTLRGTVSALLARDCTGLAMAQTSRDLGTTGMTNNPTGRSMDGGQGCVVRGTVTADSATNKLIISEVPSRLPEIIARIQQLDVRTPQVAIKAKIVFVNRTGIQDIGLAYDLGTGNRQFFQQLVPRTDPQTLRPVDTDGDGVPDATGGGTPFQGPARIALGGNAVAGIANANNAIKPNALNLIYSTALGRYQLTAFLNALQTSSLADVQSEPSVTILNNRSAEIFVGQEIPIRVIDASAGGGAAGGAPGGGAGGAAGGGIQPNAATFFPRATVSKEEAGIKLSVTPQITNNKMVLLNIKAENSSAELGASDVGVIFNRQRAESQVLVADGEAAVIGGLTVTETTRFRSGIPVLMNLPIIGRFFSQNTTNETKRDLLILVTPHILDEGVTPPPGR